MVDATDLKLRFSRFLSFALLINLAQFTWVIARICEFLLFVRGRAEMTSFLHKLLHNPLVLSRNTNTRASGTEAR